MPNETILIVEDEIANAESLSELLKTLGYNLLPYSRSGEMAIQTVRENPVDLILMDVRLLGKMDGVQTVAEINQMRGVPVIFLTASTDEETINRIRRTAPYMYLVKPIDPVELRMSVEMALLRYRVGQQLFGINKIALLMAQSLNLEAALPAILEEITQITSMEAGWIYTWEANSKSKKIDVRLNLEQKSLLIQNVDQLIEYASANQDPILINLLESGEYHIKPLNEPGREFSDNGHVPSLEKFQNQSFSPATRLAAIVVPLVIGTQGRGFLALRTGHWQDSIDIPVYLLTTVAHLVALEIEKAAMMRASTDIEIVQELNHLRSELVANVSHELRTPLGLIKIFCSTLLREDIQVDEITRAEFLKNINEEADKLEHIVANLLDLSRMEKQRLNFNPQDIDLRLLLFKVAEEFRVNAPENIQVTFNLPDLPLMAYVDAKRIEQVLRNVMENAIKYSPQGGEIALNAASDGRENMIWIKDQGVGIAEAELERIFERFYRVEDDSIQHVGGTGLGLAISRNIVEAHDGHIWAESQPGSGSTFYIYLPVSKNNSIEGSSDE